MSEQPRAGSTAPESSPGSEPGPDVVRAPEHPFRWLLGPAILLLAIVLVRSFLVAPFSIPSGSMEDTLLVGDRILVNRTVSPSDLQRGDVIVFDGTRVFQVRTPERNPVEKAVRAVAGLVGLGDDSDYVKRIVGLPGDRVSSDGRGGPIRINGVEVEEPYLKPGQAPSQTPFDVILPEDRYWVMGDNRGNSSDSRSHLGDPGGGMLAGEDIIGRAWVRYWPLDRLGTIENGTLSSIQGNGNP